MNDEEYDLEKLRFLFDIKKDLHVSMLTSIAFPAIVTIFGVTLVLDGAVPPYGSFLSLAILVSVLLWFTRWIKNWKKDLTKMATQLDSYLLKVKKGERLPPLADLLEAMTESKRAR